MVKVRLIIANQYVLLEIRELKELKVTLVNKALKVKREIPELRVNRVFKVLKVKREIPELRVRQELMVEE